MIGPRKTLPYVTNTETGTRIDADLPLHPSTVSIIRVNQMLDAVLGLIDREVKLDRSTANGDVLQALAMALAIRSAMIEAPKHTTDRLSADLLRTALTALDDARTSTPPSGTA
jgi:hypothetical protein